MLTAASYKTVLIPETINSLYIKTEPIKQQSTIWRVHFMMHRFMYGWVHAIVRTCVSVISLNLYVYKTNWTDILTYDCLVPLHLMHHGTRQTGSCLSTWILHHLRIDVKTKQRQPSYNNLVFHVVCVAITTYCVPFGAVLWRICAVKVVIAFIVVVQAKVLPFGYCLVNRKSGKENEYNY